MKNKFLYILLSILTLGLLPIFVNKSAKSEKVKVTVNATKLKTLLGKDNVSGVEYTPTKVKIFIKDKGLINVEEIQNLKGITGVFASSKSITIIVGKQAKELAALI